MVMPMPAEACVPRQPLGVPGELALQVERRHRGGEDHQPDRGGDHQLEQREATPLLSWG
jgi:hypothetical protein